MVYTDSVISWYNDYWYGDCHDALTNASAFMNKHRDGRNGYDVVSSENEYVIAIALLGVKPTDIVVSVFDNRISVAYKLSCKIYKSYKSFVVVASYDASAMTAKLSLGILTLCMPKATQPRCKIVTIEVA